MRPALRGWVLAPVLLLAACVSAEPGEVGVASPDADPPPAPRLSLTDANARLPAEAAGFRRGQSLPLRSNPRGQEVAYATPAHRQRAAAVVKLLPVGPTLADGVASPQATAAFEAELNDAVHGPDRARRLRAGARLTLPAGQRPALACAELEGTYGRQPVEGLVCAGAVGGNLVRLRVSMPRQQPSLADAQAFASAIVAALAAR